MKIHSSVMSLKFALDLLLRNENERGIGELAIKILEGLPLDSPSFLLSG